MINDYEYPKCHNKFPISNKIVHDARCTAENPMPLDKSRIAELNPQNDSNQNTQNNQNLPINEPEQPKHIEQKIPEVHVPQENRNINPPLRKPPSGEFPDVFECEICHQLFMVKEKEDHMLCHNLEKEENRIRNDFQPSREEIAQQREIERQIERNNRMNQNRNNNPNNNYINNNNNRGQRREGNFLNEMRNAISRQQQINNNNNNNNNNNRPQGHHSNMVVSYSYTGPNGERITRTYRNNGEGGGQGQDINLNNNMNMNIPPIFFGSSSRRNRRNISFLDLNNNNFGDIFDQFFSMIGNRESPTDQEILNELPETQIEDVTKLDAEKKNCVICLEDFKNGDKACVLPCIHIFHTHCIKQWLQSKNFCPICKFKLTGENLNSAQANM